MSTPLLGASVHKNEEWSNRASSQVRREKELDISTLSIWGRADSGDSSSSGDGKGDHLSRPLFQNWEKFSKKLRLLECLRERWMTSKGERGPPSHDLVPW